MTQFGLFADDRPLYLVAVCPDCGPIAKVEVKGPPGAPWGQAEKWCYIARCEHDRQVHGAT